MVSIVRISALTLADTLAVYAMYVMMNYLTDVWNLSIIHAAGIINIWDGIRQVLPILFAHVVDAFMGDFYMLAVSTIAYTFGLGLLSMSTPPVFGSCSEYKEECIGQSQKVLFFTALPLIAVGMAGHAVSLEPFLDRQTESENITENTEIISSFRTTVGFVFAVGFAINIESLIPFLLVIRFQGVISGLQIAGLLILGVVQVAGAIALQYIKPWSIRFQTTCICTLVATVVFISGCRGYRPAKTAEGSPLTTIVRVFVAAARNRRQPLPDSTLLYNDENAPSTSTLRCLDKAAIILPGVQSKNWMLCSVRQVEDTKSHIRIVPMWLTFIVTGVVLSIGNTYFVEQANTMDRKVGRVHVPIQMFFALSTYISIKTQAMLTQPILDFDLRSWIGGISALMVYSTVCCCIAAKVEARRLAVIKDHNLLDKPNETIPMTIFWLIPQFWFLGMVDGIANTAITNFFKQEAPESMHKYLTHITKAVLGLGTMASALSVYIMGKVSERNQNPNWFQPTLNESRFDRYFWMLAALCATNLLVFLVILSFYTYNDVTIIPPPPLNNDHPAEDRELDVRHV